MIISTQASSHLHAGSIRWPQHQPCIHTGEWGAGTSLHRQAHTHHCMSCSFAAPRLGRSLPLARKVYLRSGSATAAAMAKTAAAAAAAIATKELTCGVLEHKRNAGVCDASSVPGSYGTPSIPVFNSAPKPRALICLGGFGPKP